MEEDEGQKKEKIKNVEIKLKKVFSLFSINKITKKWTYVFSDAPKLLRITKINILNKL